ncbi:MAG: helix-turn-helix domain-containing protein [Thermodesulfovibrionales bacterium]|jgi:excisionase family DNA binding protein|nr:helix-turn-helix domain-containing protein [Thermodesulfovibrionales bacterium]
MRVGNIWLTTGQAAKMLGCCYNTVKQMCKNGELTGWKHPVTGTWAVSLDSISRLQKRRKKS